MQASLRLRKRKQFSYAYNRGRSKSLPELSLVVARSGKLLIGFSVGRKVGGAVVRNRVKRRLREAVRPYAADLRPAIYVFVARKPAAGMSFWQLKDAVLGLFRRHSAFMDRPETARGQ